MPRRIVFALFFLAIFLQAGVCGRPTKCKQFFRQIWQCDQVLTCVQPLDAA